MVKLSKMEQEQKMEAKWFNLDECFNIFKEYNKYSEIDEMRCGTLNDLICHEICFYFLMKPRGTQTLNSNSYTQGVKENMYWIPKEYC